MLASERDIIALIDDYHEQLSQDLKSDAKSGDDDALGRRLQSALGFFSTLLNASVAYLELELNGHQINQVYLVNKQRDSMETQRAIQARLQSLPIAQLRNHHQLLLTDTQTIDKRGITQYSEYPVAACIPWLVLDRSRFNHFNSGAETGQARAILYLAGGEPLQQSFRGLQQKAYKLLAVFNDILKPQIANILSRSDNIDYRHGLGCAKEKPLLTKSDRKDRGKPDDNIIGRSSALQNCLRQAAMVAPLDVNVLITGQSGTGKSQLARAIHEKSLRSAKRLLEINCAALPEPLLENELFGSSVGGHSSAVKPVKGKISAASGGTLFLDEISELPLSAQAKLLQFLQTGEYYPLGAAEPLQSDIRIICATNSDLQQAVIEKKFRQDLYYRIKTFPLRMPSLQERSEDIALLALHFGEQICQQHNFPKLQISAATLRCLQQMPWPGNVRELYHCVEAACIRAACDQQRQIEPVHLFAELAEPEDLAATREGQTFVQATKQFQMEFLKARLEASDWNVSQTARQLKLSRSHIHSLINSFELETEKKTARAAKKIGASDLT